MTFWMNFLDIEDKSVFEYNKLGEFPQLPKDSVKYVDIVKQHLTILRAPATKILGLPAKI